MILTPKDVERARELSKHYHQEQRRQTTQEPYHVHPQGVVDILEDCGYKSPEIQCIAYLHDTIEDTDFRRKQIREVFGKEVEHGVYVLSNNTFKEHDIEMFRTLHKISPEVMDDKTIKKLIYQSRLIHAKPKIIRVKAADVIYNSRDLSVLRPERAKRMSQDITDFYIPLLGTNEPLLRRKLEENLEHFQRSLHN